MDRAALLQHTMTKLWELQKIRDWQCELVPRALPVLWFGDSEATKPRILTVAANPSRSEFLDRKKRLRMSPHNRLEISQDEALFSVITDHFAAQVFRGYNRYFEHIPYRTWFGRQGGGKVEGFLNGMGASYYNSSYDSIGLHVDLFPFATMSNFTEIADVAARDLFENGWAQDVLLRLIRIIEPMCVVVVGKTNTYCVQTYMSNMVNWEDRRHQRFDHGRSVVFDRGLLTGTSLPVAGISLNLGNPIGWTSAQLRVLGAWILAELATQR